MFEYRHLLWWEQHWDFQLHPQGSFPTVMSSVGQSAVARAARLSLGCSGHVWFHTALCTFPQYSVFLPLVSESFILLSLVCASCHWEPTPLEGKDDSLLNPVALRELCDWVIATLVPLVLSDKDYPGSQESREDVIRPLCYCTNLKSKRHAEICSCCDLVEFLWGNFAGKVDVTAGMLVLWGQLATS